MKRYDPFDTGPFLDNEDIYEAAALKYDTGRDNAPRVTALGKGYAAQSMIKAARESGVQVIKDSKVSPVLHKLSVGSEIPEQLYKAVAEILSFVCSIDHDRRHKFKSGITKG